MVWCPGHTLQGALCLFLPHRERVPRTFQRHGASACITVTRLSHLEHPPQGVCQLARGGSDVVRLRVLRFVADDLEVVGITAHGCSSCVGENMLSRSRRGP